MVDRNLTIKGSNIRYREFGQSSGASKHLLFLHGLGSSSDRWIDIPEAFSRHYHTIAVDLIGFGGSDSPKLNYTINTFREFILDFMSSIQINSPLFRDKFDPVNGHANDNIEPMTAPAVRQYYNRLLHSIGIRKEAKRRHEFSVHGFRKWYKTRCELGGMKPINVEILLSHSTGISDSYYRPTESELLDDYLKVVDQLMMNDTRKLRAEAQEINKIKERETVNSDAIGTLSDQVMKLTAELERMKLKHLS